MNHLNRYALLLLPLALIACKKKVVEGDAAPATAIVVPAAPAAGPAAAPAENLTDAQKELARKQSLVEYGVMEDGFLKDPRAQWAASAQASSTEGGAEARDDDKPAMAVGPLDGKNWTNEHADIGFDTLELTYAKPVNATEVRMVTIHGKHFSSITKIELQDTDGKWHDVWTGFNEEKDDERGSRTWMVKKFDKTPYKTKTVRYTITNNLYHATKSFDAAQLVGD